jgi:hypothetical protein
MTPLLHVQGGQGFGWVGGALAKGVWGLPPFGALALLATTGSVFWIQNAFVAPF